MFKCDYCKVRQCKRFEPICKYGLSAKFVEIKEKLIEPSCQKIVEKKDPNKIETKVLKDGKLESLNWMVKSDE